MGAQGKERWNLHWQTSEAARPSLDEDCDTRRDQYLKLRAAIMTGVQSW